MPYKAYDILDTHITDLMQTSSVSLDEVLYLGISGSQDNNNEYRVLVTFDTVNVLNDFNNSNADVFLQFELLDNYPRYDNIVINSYIVSGSFEYGIGKVKLPDQSSVSWQYRSNNVQWATSSYTNNVTSSYYNDVWGGGNYYNVSASYSVPNNIELDNIEIPITSLLTYSTALGISIDGILLRATSDVLRLYSNETHTIYKPKIICKIPNNTTVNITDFDTLNNLNLVVSNMMEMYYNDQSYRFILKASKVSTVKQFLRNKLYTNDINYIPPTSYYSIVDIETNRVIVPFGDYTKINSDYDNGNYFDIYFNVLLPYRKYKFVFKIVKGSETKYFESPIFKIHP